MSNPETISTVYTVSCSCSMTLRQHVIGIQLFRSTRFSKTYRSYSCPADLTIRKGCPGQSTWAFAACQVSSTILVRQPHLHDAHDLRRSNSVLRVERVGESENSTSVSYATPYNAEGSSISQHDIVFVTAAGGPVGAWVHVRAPHIPRRLMGTIAPWYN